MPTAEHTPGEPAHGGPSAAAPGYPALTGVRALAATMVFWHHYLPSARTWGWTIHSLFKELHIGVTIFFVLSGFLIYLRHSSAESLDRVPLLRYAFHRFARIYPMYFLVVVGMATWTALYDPLQFHLLDTLQTVLLQLTFIRGFSNELKFIGVGQGWTLTVEVTFYVLYPVLLRLIRRWGFVRVLLLTYATGLALYGLGLLINRDSYFTPFQFTLCYTFFGRALEFFGGMMLADYVRRKGIAEGASGIPWFTTGGVLGIAASVCALAFLEPSRQLFGTDNPIGAVLFIFGLPPLVCMFFYGLISEASWLARFFGSRLVVTLGASSYCFYLIHVGGPDLIIGHWAYQIGFFYAYLLLLCISVLLWALVEEPLRRLILSHHLFPRSKS
jgi:peptidoglycan/LPS O-acetylase OafA/YrhL